MRDFKALNKDRRLLDVHDRRPEIENLTSLRRPFLTYNEGLKFDVLQTSLKIRQE